MIDLVFTEEDIARLLKIFRTIDESEIGGDAYVIGLEELTKFRRETRDPVLKEAINWFLQPEGEPSIEDGADIFDEGLKMTERWGLVEVDRSSDKEEMLRLKPDAIARPLFDYLLGRSI